MRNLAIPSTRIVLALLVSGCSGASFAPGAETIGAPTNSGSATVRQNTGGGAFTAQYSGPYSFAPGCTASANGHLKFSGSGHASYLHRSTESGKMTGKLHGSRCVWSGKTTLTASRRSRNSVTFSLGLNGSQYHNPCNNAVGFVVKRGTGKFANATGNGTVTFSCTDSGFYLDKWSGTLTF